MFLPVGIIYTTFTEKSSLLYSNNFRIRENVFSITIGLINIMLELDEADY
jgi:hypothetical protein